jgi:hypothetical protein
MILYWINNKNGNNSTRMYHSMSFTVMDGEVVGKVFDGREGVGMTFMVFLWGFEEIGCGFDSNEILVWVDKSVVTLKIFWLQG